MCARGFKEGAAEGLPALRLSTSKAPRAPARCSPLRRPPPPLLRAGRCPERRGAGVEDEEAAARRAAAAADA